jgi:tyrosyl-tRNA synthetase
MEARKSTYGQFDFVNKKKIKEDFILSVKDLINNQFILLKAERKNYFVVRIV